MRIDGHFLVQEIKIVTVKKNIKLSTRATDEILEWFNTEIVPGYPVVGNTVIL